MLSTNQNYQTTGSIVAFTTLATSYIIRVTKVDNSLYGVIYPIINELLNNITTYKVEFDKSILYCCIPLIVLYLFIMYRKDIVEYIKTYRQQKIRQDNTDYLILTLYDENKITKYMKYEEYNSDFYTKADKYDFGNPSCMDACRSSPDITKLSTYTRSADEFKNYFEDKNFNVNGYYVWLSREVKLPEKIINDKIIESKAQIPYIQIFIDKKTCKNSLKYYKDITNFVNNKTLDISVFYHARCFLKENVIVSNNEIMYCGRKQTIEELEKMYIAPFFHNEKDKLWRMLKMLDTNPEKIKALGQTPRSNLLLYGPPGSGKSTFAYRIARTLKRHIVSLDIRLITTKAKLYQIMKKPFIENMERLPCEVVFILDEFDLTITEIQRRTEHKNKLLNKMFTTEPTEDDKTPPSCLSSLGGYNEQIVVEDLLEIFQGPVPTEGSIIIATTNKFKEIYDICPALFRAGRLTPVYFRNADKDLMNQITMYYFNQSIELAQNFLSIVPTSQIIDIALDTVLNKDANFDYFMEEFRKSQNYQIL